MLWDSGHVVLDVYTHISRKSCTDMTHGRGVANHVRLEAGSAHL